MAVVSWTDSCRSSLVGVDGFSIFMVCITALLFPIGMLAAARQDHRVKAYTFWFLLLEGVIMGIFLSLDLICFFIFWEAMLVPMYFLISGWGSDRRVYAAMKFFIYTAAGSAFLLASILVLGFLHQNATGNLTFDYRDSDTATWPRLGPKQYFVMGDNRIGSCDSRTWGPVPRASFIGPVVATYWPPWRWTIR